jgi:hypothetical protein
MRALLSGALLSAVCIATSPRAVPDTGKEASVPLCYFRGPLPKPSYQGEAVGPSRVLCVGDTGMRPELSVQGPQCANEEFRKRGTPVMAPANRGVAFGVSSSPERPTRLYIWLDNQTDELQPYYACCGSTFMLAIDLYDAAGQRVPQDWEKPGNKLCGVQGGFGCGCSAILCAAPHTMKVVDDGELQRGYALSPGQYFVVPSKVGTAGRACESVDSDLADSTKAGHPNAIRIVIPQNCSKTQLIPSH